MYPRSAIIAFVSLCTEIVMRLIDRTGMRYSYLVVTGRAPNKSERDTNARWHCKCDCGKETIAYGQDLGRGIHRSCGCMATSYGFDYGKAARTHGMSRTVLYRAWQGMLMRCNKASDFRFKHYGARGIKVCDRWLKFENFMSDMGFPEKGLSLDRINVNGNYEPGNCRWATKQVQAANRRNSVKLTHNGITATIAEWSRALGISASSMHGRIASGFSGDKLFSRNLRLYQE